MKILIVASNPRGDLKLGEEIRDLKGVIERSRNQEQLKVEIALAVRPGDLQELLLKHSPEIVHFCGHGTGEQGLVLQSDAGGEQLVSTDALSNLFENFSEHVGCILLNACYSEIQANAMIQHINYVIGMSQEIRDDAAIAFATGFYRALGYERSIEQSYKLGCNQIQLTILGSGNSVSRSVVSEEQRKLEVDEVVAARKVIPEHLKPILKKKANLTIIPDSAVSKPDDHISREQQVEVQIDIDRAFGKEIALKQYREKVREFWADRKLTDVENIQLGFLKEDLGLSDEEAKKILEEEQAQTRQAQQAYKKMLVTLIEQRRYPFNDDIRNDLKKFQAEKNLSDEEVEQISKPIFEAAEVEYQGKLRQQYEQEFKQVIEVGYPIDEVARDGLKNLQQSLQLTDEEISQIERPVIAQKEAKYRKQQEAERIRQQQEAERRQQEEYEQKLIKTLEAGNSLNSYRVQRWLRQLQRDLRLKDTDIAAIEARVVASRRPVTPPPPIPQPSPAQPSGTTPLRINRKQFLKWSGLGGAGLVTAVVGREIFKGQLPTPISTIQPTNKPTTISVAAPKYISPTEGGRKALGLPLWTVQFETVTVDEKGQVAKRDSNQQAKFFKEDLGNGVTLEMVSIPGGSFKMGSPPGEKGWQENEGPQHNVNVPAFFMGRFEVTQAQYQQVMGKKPSYFKGDKRPVESVSWNDAVEFCKKLSQKTGRTYRLPSEAEWEYAARAGTTTPFHFGETITGKIANCNASATYASEPPGEYRQQTTPVGSFPRNAFGLYDMHGNVWEWCADTWHDNYKGVPTDGSAWIQDGDDNRSPMRGGSWLYYPGSCRSAFRNYDIRERDDFNHDIGFRVVCGVGRTKSP